MNKTDYTLSVIIPCYNEKNSIRTIVDKVLASPVKNKEIIVVDDMSTDGTRDILEKEIKPLVSRIVYHEVNQGKGGALRTGFQYATGDIVIVQDADLEYDPDEYPLVTDPIANDECDVCYGSRFLNQEKKGYKANQLANTFLTWLSNRFTHLNLTDMETCYKAFRRDIIQSVNIQESRFGFEPEITAKIAAMHVRVKEVPVSYYPRTNTEGKKIGVKDGIRAIWCIWKYRKG
ncbi:MAG: glycosyltransferase family 2 protein [Solobacterium sp.]|nr:glycosyltransferase family 2 protein [Solobacterium sp.]